MNSVKFYKIFYSKIKDTYKVKKIAQDFGGCSIYIPKKILSHHIFKEYGEEFCKILENKFSGRVIYFPIFNSRVEDSLFKQQSLLEKIKYSIIKYKFKK